MNSFRKEDKFVGKPTGLGQKFNIEDPSEGKDFDINYAVLGGGGPVFCCIGVETIGSVSQDVSKPLDKFLVKINKMVIRSRFIVWNAVTDTVCPGLDELGDPCPNYLVPEATGPMGETLDTEVPIYIGVSPAGGLSVEEIMRQTQEMGGPWVAEDNLEANSYEIDITKFITQPKDPAYTGNLVITFYWGNSNYYWYSAIANGLDFSIVQKDQEFEI